MSFTPIIDVAIGLVFVYLLLGLIATGVQEVLTSYLSVRGKLLKQAIADLTGGGSQSASLFVSVFHHPLVTSTAATKLPSYLPSHTFALAVIDTLSKGGQAPVFSQIEQGLISLPAGPARDSLAVLVKNAAGDLDALKLSIATWFDDAMDRVSGVYKRGSQYFAVTLGLALAIGLNVDSVSLANRLWHDEALRNSVVTQAEALDNIQKQLTSSPPKSDQEKLQAAKDNLKTNLAALQGLSLPIGWQDAGLCAPPGAGVQLAAKDPCAKAAEQKPGSFDFWLWRVKVYFWHIGIVGFLLAVMGWCITAIATAMGAPFWFDMLRNLFNVRGAGPKPAKADGTGGGT